jgi:glycosyltransferase involved in cell wall biosynthesis
MRYTIVTPTYDRAHTLERAYKSLCAQTFRDFEWIIIDDGSVDGTNDLVESWKTFFRIRYEWKPNGGKHTAMNRGVSLAKSDFVVFFDSDDSCTANALERFDYHWRQIPDPSRFASLYCLCRRVDGTVVGEPYPADLVDAFSYADQVRHRVWDRWAIHRTDVLRQFPWPEGERFCPESLVWNRISRKYAARFFNECLLMVHPSPDGLSHKMFFLRASSPRTTLTHYGEFALSPAPPKMRLRAALNFVRFAALAALPPFLSRHLLRG